MQNKRQTHVYLPTLRATAENPNPPALSTLVLDKITYTHLAIVLHFGTFFLMVGGGFYNFLALLTLLS